MLPTASTCNVGINSILYYLLYYSLFCCGTCVSKMMWRTVEQYGSMQPSPRRDFAIVYSDRSSEDKLLLFGGRNKYKNKIYDDVWLFGLRTKKWDRVVSSNGVHPSARHSMVYGISKGQFIVAMGAGYYGVLFNDVWCFDVASNLWSVVHAKIDPDRPAPQPRYASGGGVYPDSCKLHVTFGVTHHGNWNTWSFDLESRLWSLESELWHPYTPWLPHPRNSHTAVPVSQDSLVLTGGCLADSSSAGPCPSSDSWLYHAHAWRRLSPCHYPANHAAATLYPVNQPSYIILHGGSPHLEPLVAVPPPLANQLSVYDVSTSHWFTVYANSTLSGMSQFPTPRSGHGFLSTRMGAVLYGGEALENYMLTDMWSLDGDLVPTDTCDNASSSVTYILLHGVTMFLAYGVLLQLGGLISRYLPHHRHCYKLHVLIQGSGLLVSLLGFSFACMSVSKDHFRFSHGLIGFVIILMGFLQPMNALFKPRDDQTNNPLLLSMWKGLHKVTGRLILILSLVNITLGLFLAVAPSTLWATWFVYLAGIVIVYVALETRMKWFQTKATEYEGPDSVLNNRDNLAVGPGSTYRDKGSGDPGYIVHDPGPRDCDHVSRDGDSVNFDPTYRARQNVPVLNIVNRSLLVHNTGPQQTVMLEGDTYSDDIHKSGILESSV